MRVVNIEKEMKSKIYIALIIIWLMYLSRGKIILSKKLHYVFVILPNEDLTSRIFLKSATKNRYAGKYAKTEQIIKTKRKYVVDIVAKVQIFYFVFFRLFLFL